MKRELKYLIALVFIIIIVITSSIIFISFLGSDSNSDDDDDDNDDSSDILSYFIIEIYKPEKAYNGTTLFADLSDSNAPRIVEINMRGQILWQYILPNNLKNYTNPGMDVELLNNNNILFVAPRKGVYEINRSGNIVWSFEHVNVSHDADKLPNNNTLIVWGGNDTHNDPQVIEVNRSRDIVWSWKAKDHYFYEPLKSIWMQGWTHANAVTRLKNNNTLINLRNFNLTVEVNKTGHIVREFNWTDRGDDPHEPEMQPNGNLLIGLQWTAPFQVVEINTTTRDVVWKYHRNNLTFTRDADRLPNNNTLIVGVVGNSPKIFEVTRDGEIVWQVAVRGKYLSGLSPGWFYKAQRI